VIVDWGHNSLLRAVPLLPREDVRQGSALELGGHELGGLPPAHSSLHRGANAAQELVHP
jgi:hypothetical protein